MSAALDHHDLDPGSLRSAYSQFPSGVAAICAIVDGSPVGLAASSFTSVSLDPPLVSVCLQRTSRTWVQLRSAASIGVSVLSAEQDEVCRRLSRREGDRFNGVPWYRGTAGSVLVDGASLHLETTIEQELDGGDHVIVLLRVVDMSSFPQNEPAVFHRSSFRVLR